VRYTRYADAEPKLTELAVQDKAEQLAEEIHQSTAKIAEELLTHSVQVQTDDPLLAFRYR
jgi:hypothetical protein